MNRLALEHIHRNRLTRDSWDVFAPHREQVTELILSSKHNTRQKLAGVRGESSHGRLCVLGAGNSNDLDLARLAKYFEQIHLIDLDGSALAEGVSRQFSESEAPDKIRLVGDIDLTGLHEKLVDWSPESPPPDAELTRLIEMAESVQIPVDSNTYEVVVSACLLTQLIDSLKIALAETHPRFNELALAVRNRHLRLLTEMIAPGGIGVLITDLVSSDTCGELADLSDAELPHRAREWIATGNFFTGVNPAAIQSHFQEDETLQAQGHAIEITQPWRWSLGSRCYAVYALLLR